MFEHLAFSIDILKIQLSSAITADFWAAASRLT
jgi:hypothetical protein